MDGNLITNQHLEPESFFAEPQPSTSNWNHSEEIVSNDDPMWSSSGPLIEFEVANNEQAHPSPFTFHPMDPARSLYEESYIFEPERSFFDEPQPSSSQTSNYSDKLLTNADPMWSCAGPLEREVNFNHQPEEPRPLQCLFPSDMEVHEWLATFPPPEYEVEERERQRKKAEEEAEEEAMKKMKEEWTETLKQLRQIPLSFFSRLRLRIHPAN